MNATSLPHAAVIQCGTTSTEGSGFAYHHADAAYAASRLASNCLHPGPFERLEPGQERDGPASVRRICGVFSSSDRNCLSPFRAARHAVYYFCLNSAAAPTAIERSMPRSLPADHLLWEAIWTAIQDARRGRATGALSCNWSIFSPLLGFFRVLTNRAAAREGGLLWAGSGCRDAACLRSRSSSLTFAAGLHHCGRQDPAGRALHE